MKKSSDDKKRDEVLKRMLQMPHKPHVPVAMKAAKKANVDKSVAKRKKGDGPIVKNRRPKGA